MKMLHRKVLPYHIYIKLFTSKMHRKEKRKHFQQCYRQSYPNLLQRSYASAMILIVSSEQYQEASNRFGKDRVRSMTSTISFHKLQAYNHYICCRKKSKICYLTHYQPLPHF